MESVSFEGFADLVFDFCWRPSSLAIALVSSFLGLSFFVGFETSSSVEAGLGFLAFLTESSATSSVAIDFVNLVKHVHRSSYYLCVSFLV